MINEDLLARIKDKIRRGEQITVEDSDAINNDMLRYLGLQPSPSYYLSGTEVDTSNLYVREWSRQGVGFYRCALTNQIGLVTAPTSVAQTRLILPDRPDRPLNIRPDCYAAIGGQCRGCGVVKRKNMLFDVDGLLYCQSCRNTLGASFCDTHNIWHKSPCEAILAAMKDEERHSLESAKKAREDQDFFARMNAAFPGMVYPEKTIGEDNLRSPRNILSYSANVLEHLKIPYGISSNDPPEEGERLWLGVELEVEPKTGVNSSINAGLRAGYTMKDKAIIKADGSLGPGGFEIVSIPGTLEWHREAWTDFFIHAAPFLRSWDTGRCGLHVHISCRALSKLTLGKMLLFVNADGNRSFIEKVAGRNSSQWSTFQPKKIGDGKVKISSHHEALSFSQRNHGETIELRIARGNVAKNGFYRILEFAAMLPDFCKQAGADARSANVKNLTSENFIKWFSHQSNYSRYPEFAKWARKKGLIKITSKLRAQDLVLEAA